MGFFDKIFGRPKDSGAQQARQTFDFLEGYTPAWHTFKGSIYESELIRAALDAHGRHAAKLTPVINGAASPSLRNRLTLQPNAWQTWPKFLYRLAVTLYARNTAFIVPVLGEYGETNGIIGVVPHSWELVEYKGEPYLRFRLAKNKTVAIELYRVGILTRYQYENEIFGASNDAMRPTLDLIAIQRQGITEGIKNHSNYKFYARSGNFSKDSDLANERKRFDAANFRGDTGGVLLFPNTYQDIHQITSSQYNINEKEQEAIKNNVFDYFAVNEEIIQNKSFGDAWLAFYEGATEWLAINASEVITQMLYSVRERQAGNRIFFTANRLQYMSNADKLNTVSQMADRGLMTRNELREIFNLAPLPEPFGSQIPARGEYYDITHPDDSAESGADPQEDEGGINDAGEQ